MGGRQAAGRALSPVDSCRPSAQAHRLPGTPGDHGTRQPLSCQANHPRSLLNEQIYKLPEQISLKQIETADPGIEVINRTFQMDVCVTH